MNFKKYKKLSILKNAESGVITYYVGNNISDVIHLKNCLLICKPDFNPILDGVELFKVDDPQLFFYKLSEDFKKDYLDIKNLKFIKSDSYIRDKDSKIGKNTTIFPNCVIGECYIGDDVIIHPNCVIYSETDIGNNVTIESNSVIGAEGVMWVWDGNTRVKLHQLGNVKIEDDVFIGSNVSIVRGSSNETTVIGTGTMIAHGTKIGHGCIVGKNNHFANNVSFGGSVETADDCFFGCGSTVSPGVKISHKIVLGSGSTLTSSPESSGVYVGIPAKKIKEISGKLKGVPFSNERI